MEDTKPQASDDSNAWIAYWSSHDQMWRTEPEIPPDRQTYLAKRRAITPDIKQGIYPFKGIEPKLTRADIEWLLATHTRENHTGPIDPANKQQIYMLGIDLRGAILSALSLEGLPLANLQGGLHPNLIADLAPEFQADAIEAAAVHLEGAN